MNTERHQITVRGLPVQIVRKAIKHLHLGVYPPNGRVRVAAPLAVSDEAVRLAVIARLSWITRQRAKFEGQARQTEREMVTGESHYYLGRRYRLRVVEDHGPGRVVVRGHTTLELHVRASIEAVARTRVLERWYREQLRALVPPLLAAWQDKLGVEVNDWRIRKMKTKWGSCSVATRRIWLNLELVKKPPQCLEYLVVHELVHLIAPRHDERFVALMDQHLPGWRQHRHLLNSAPLVHETWDY